MADKICNMDQSLLHLLEDIFSAVIGNSGIIPDDLTFVEDAVYALLLSAENADSGPEEKSSFEQLLYEILILGMSSGRPEEVTTDEITMTPLTTAKTDLDDKITKDNLPVPENYSISDITEEKLCTPETDVVSYKMRDFELCTPAIETVKETIVDIVVPTMEEKLCTPETDVVSYMMGDFELCTPAIETVEETVVEIIVPTTEEKLCTPETDVVTYMMGDFELCTPAIETVVETVVEITVPESGDCTAMRVEVENEEDVPEEMKVSVGVLPDKPGQQPTQATATANPRRKRLASTWKWLKRAALRLCCCGMR